MTANAVFEFIANTADQAFSFTFKCFGYEISWYNLMFCSLIFFGFFSILGTKIDLGIEQNNIARNQTRRDKVRAENERKNAEINRHNEMRNNAKKDGVPLKK